MSTTGIEPSGIELPMPTHGSYPTCEHPLLPKPAFDEDAAATCSAGEVRRRWPRLDSRCPNCGERVLMYASHKHYIYGDW